MAICHAAPTARNRGRSAVFIAATLWLAGTAMLPAQTYCSSSAFSPSVQWIERVQLTNLDHTSTTSATGYQNHTAFSATLTPGVASTLTVTASYGGAGTFVRVYFDLNGDGVFNDAGGAGNLALFGPAGPHSTYFATVAPPANAASPTRMRVILSGTPNVPSCGLYTQGETEDYTVLVGPQVPPYYQANQPRASFNINGANAGLYSPTIVNTTADDVCTFGTVTVTWTSILGLHPYEIGLTAGGLVPAPNGGALVFPGGQILNLALGDPTFTFLFGGTFPPMFGASIPVAPGGPYDVSAQLVVLDAASVDGFVLSQAQSLHVAQVPPPAFPTVLLGAGAGSVAIPGASFGGCAIPFYGTNYTQVFVSTNGRLSFGDVEHFAYPYVPGTMASPGGFGEWCELDSTFGSAPLTSPAAGVLRVDFVNLRYLGTSITVNFSLLLDANTGMLTIDGIAGVPLNPVHPTDQVWIGTSRGSGATDAGQTPYANFLGLGLQPGPTSSSPMIYQRGTEGTFAPGINTVTFTPNGFGNYDFTVS